MKRFKFGTDTSDENILALGLTIRRLCSSAGAAITDCLMIAIMIRVDLAKAHGDTFSEDDFIKEVRELLDDRKRTLSS